MVFTAISEFLTGLGGSRHALHELEDGSNDMGILETFLVGDLMTIT